MPIFYAVLAGILLGYISGGRLKHIAQHPFRMTWLTILGFAIQFALFSNTSLSRLLKDTTTVILHFASYILLFIFVSVNFKIRGIPLIGLGIFSNFLAISLNGGYMPVITENLMAASNKNSTQAIMNGETVRNSIAIGADTLFTWLCDIFHLPSWMPFSNVFSIGDIIIGVGICIYFIFAMKDKKTAENNA